MLFTFSKLENFFKSLLQKIKKKIDGIQSSSRIIPDFSFVKKKSIAFILSDFISPNFEKPLKIASNKHDLTGIKVYDNFEKEIPNLGLVKMQDQETGQFKLIDTSSKNLRESYKKEMSLKFKNFNEIFTKNGAGTILCRTDESYIKKLLNYFKNRG